MENTYRRCNMNREVFCTNCLEMHSYDEKQCCLKCGSIIPDGIIEMSHEIVYLKEELEKYKQLDNDTSDTIVESNILIFATILEEENSIEFIHNNLYYEIFESADSGYVVNVYSSDDKDEYDDYLDKNILDGGLCTGSAEDAVRFML